MNSSEKTITLVMIVKNESKVITRCFDSVKDYIDYWVICDTGSTDGTQKIIKKYFRKEKIPGELHNDKWKNFGHNRSLAIRKAKGKSDYSLLLDADFIFSIKDKDFKKKINADGYQIKYEGGLDYRQMLFVNSNFDWKYIGVTHEYLHCPEAKKIKTLDAFAINHKCDGGSRSDKFERDIEMLKGGLKEEPGNIRYMFYLAQSYKDTKQYTNAIKWYKKRVEKGGWYEEVYYSLYQIGNCKIMRGDKFDDFKDDLWKAYKYRPVRLEALFTLVRHCRLNGMYEIGFNYGKHAIESEYPKNDMLFINKAIHEFVFYDELALCAYSINKPEIAIKLYDKFLSKGVIPDNMIDRFKTNYQFFIKKLLENKKISDELEDKSDKVAIIIVNHNKTTELDKLITDLKIIVQHPHDVIVVDNNSENKSKNTTISLNKNVEITNGWLMGLYYVDSLEKVTNERYFAYCFVTTEVELVGEKDIVAEMVKTMKEDRGVVGVHPSLTDNSQTTWKQMINTKDKEREELYFVENVFSCYRASWFNKTNRFEPELIYSWGTGIETGYKAYRDNMKILLDNTLTVKKNSSDLKTGLKEQNEKMKDVFKKKYGDIYDKLISKKLGFKKDYVKEVKIEETNKFNLSKESKIIINEYEIDETLEEGLTFLIRAKDEEKNIIRCLESLNEATKDFDNIKIIIVDNKSSDNTYQLAEEFCKDYDNMTLYEYEFDVCKIMENTPDDNKKSISTFYNWCLEKVKTNNVVKWDADFIVNINNFKEMLTEYKLNSRDDNFAMWFTGEALFEHNNIYLKKVNSFYDSYKCYSKRHGFKWSDYNNICENAEIGHVENKLRYEKPVFYEIFRTSLEEFKNKSKILDYRDKIDMGIHFELKRNSIFGMNDKKSQLETFDLFGNKKGRKTYFFVYYGYFMESGGTYVTLKTYVDYFLSQNDIVYIFQRFPFDDEVKKLKPDCIISAQFANSDINKKIKEWNLPHVVLTFAPNQYKFNGVDSKYPSLVTYSNSFIKSRDPLQKNGHIVRDPVDHRMYEIPRENMKPKYITLIGSPPNVKGHDILIKLAERFSDLDFMLVTHEKEYEGKTLPSNIKLQGYLRSVEELKEKVYAKTKILLLPSTQEAFGRVTIEAIASDIPCIISDYPGLSDITYKMSNYVKDYRNVEEWAVELQRVLGDYEKEVEKSHQIKLKLDFERDVKHFRDLVENAIENHK